MEKRGKEGESQGQCAKERQREVNRGRDVVRGEKRERGKKRAKENKGKNCKKLNDFSYSKIQFVL